VDDQKTEQFRWGMVLAWVTLIPLMYGCFNSFKGISEQKATGLAAVAGRIAEAFATFGLVAFVAMEVYAVVLLVRSMCGASWERRALCILSIAWCGCILLFFGFGA
jgi:hypothetical protein